MFYRIIDDAHWILHLFIRFWVVVYVHENVRPTRIDPTKKFPELCLEK